MKIPDQLSSAQPAGNAGALSYAASDASPILDYAGPASRGRLRLPARSDLDVQRSNNALIVTETLRGKSGAILALLFAAVTLAMIVSQAITAGSGRRWERHPITLGICITVAAAEILAVLAVIDSTWQKTVLNVQPDSTSLRFWSPLRGRRHHYWPVEKLHTAHVRQMTGGIGGGIEVSELELDLWGEPQVRLFLGHSPLQLAELAAAINQIQPRPLTA